MTRQRVMNTIGWWVYWNTFLKIRTTQIFIRTSERLRLLMPNRPVIVYPCWNPHEGLYLFRIFWSRVYYQNIVKCRPPCTTELICLFYTYLGIICTYENHIYHNSHTRYYRCVQQVTWYKNHNMRDNICEFLKQNNVKDIISNTHLFPTFVRYLMTSIT
jgi:hypothetical protein